MDWRIVAAAVALLGVLGAGTLLTTQVSADLEAGIDARAPDPPTQRPGDSPPLHLNDMKLPGNLPVEIPRGASISPDLSKLMLPDGMDLRLPDGLDLSDIDLELPQDMTLELPAGSLFSPPELSLPHGATIRLPDGPRSFELPAGSRLDLPPEVVDRLLKDGIPAGVLGEDRSIEMLDLPPELRAGLSPPKIDGPSNLKLPPGSQIVLPEGQRFPFPAGALKFAARYLLPAGTEFDVPFDVDRVPGGQFPLPTPASPQRPIDRNARGPLIAMETEITSMPERVHKGEPFTVSGYVREAQNGRPLGGVVVDIFVNESKAAPGVLVGQTRSDATGTFRAQVRVPTDQPARDYQLVDHAVGFVNATGASFDDAWGDPPFAAFAATTLTLDVPAHEPYGSPTLIAGRLLDDAGTPVLGAPVIITVDGGPPVRVITDAGGRYRTETPLAPGDHTVEAQFYGSPHYDPAGPVRASVRVDERGLEVANLVTSAPGDALALSGRVVVRGAVAPEREVRIAGIPGHENITLQSDAAGAFTHGARIPAATAPGRYLLSYHVPSFNVTKLQVLEVNLTGVIRFTAPPLWDVDEPLPVSVKLDAGTGRIVAPQTLRITLAGPGGVRDTDVVTGPDGVALLDILPLRSGPGAYTLIARVVGNPHVTTDAPMRAVTLARFDVRWENPETVVRGEAASGALTIRFADAPYANRTVTLDAFGITQAKTDASGRVAWGAVVPRSTPLGAATISVQALDHPLRGASAQVVAVPKLDLDAPGDFPVGEPVDTRLRLTDDQGAPIARSRVTLTTITDDAVQRTTIQTDADGRWAGSMNITEREGNVTLVARFDAASPYLGAESAHSLIARPPESRASGPIGAWLVPLLVLGAVGGAGGTWMLLRRRAAGTLAPPLAPPVAARALPASDITLRLSIPEGEPNVWGVGEPLQLDVSSPRPAERVHLSWEGSSTDVALDTTGRARVPLRFDAETDIIIEAGAGIEGRAPATLPLKIVDYRREIAAEFDLLLEKARALDPTLTRQSTPREVGWTLSARLGRSAEDALAEAALVMEYASYSHHAIGREHYLTFVRATASLETELAREPQEA